MNREDVQRLMRESIPPMDPDFEAGLVLEIEARMDARDAERAVEAARQKRRIPRGLWFVPAVAAAISFAAVVLLTVAWLLFGRGGSPPAPGLERPSDLPDRAGQDDPAPRPEEQK